MEENYKKNGGIDTRRAGGRPKLATYERRNHHHKVSYNDEEENIIQYKAEQAGKPDDVYLHEAGLDAVVQAHMSDENIEQLRDVCGMANNTNQIAHQANAGGFVFVRFKAEQLIISLTELSAEYFAVATCQSLQVQQTTVSPINERSNYDLQDKTRTELPRVP